MGFKIYLVTLVEVVTVVTVVTGGYMGFKIYLGFTGYRGNDDYRKLHPVYGFQDISCLHWLCGKGGYRKLYHVHGLLRVCKAVRHSDFFVVCYMARPMRFRSDRMVLLSV